MTRSSTFGRRRFLRICSASALVSATYPWSPRAASAAPPPRRRKTVLSFYCDDTGPYTAGAKAFTTFLDYCAEHRIAGESTLLLGARGCMSRRANEDEQAYLEEVRRAWSCGIDTHMELMTHRGLFDFDALRETEGAAHEGLWLHEPAITVEQYERYFSNILAEGERVGVRFTGLTWPGCGCDVCTRRYAELRQVGHKDPNPAIWTALLNLAKQGKFRGPTVPCFFGSSETDFGIHRKASDGQYAVFDLMPNARDNFGIWENNPARVNADYYITADGQSGIVARHVRSGAPYCIWYAHWQGLNPAKGVGWKAFTEVVSRIEQHLKDQVIWMRPSDITAKYQQSGGWAFLDGLA